MFRNCRFLRKLKKNGRIFAGTAGKPDKIIHLKNGVNAIFITQAIIFILVRSTDARSAIFKWKNAAHGRAGLILVPICVFNWLIGSPMEVKDGSAVHRVTVAIHSDPK